MEVRKRVAHRIDYSLNFTTLYLARLLHTAGFFIPHFAFFVWIFMSWNAGIHWSLPPTKIQKSTLSANDKQEDASSSLSPFSEIFNTQI